MDRVLNDAERKVLPGSFTRVRYASVVFVGGKVYTLSTLYTGSESLGPFDQEGGFSGRNTETVVYEGRFSDDNRTIIAHRFHGTLESDSDALERHKDDVGDFLGGYLDDQLPCFGLGDDHSGYDGGISPEDHSGYDGWLRSEDQYPS